MPAEHVYDADQEPGELPPRPTGVWSGLWEEFGFA
jgi:hypothetical protein